jgi:hypothetical protein
MVRLGTWRKWLATAGFCLLTGSAGATINVVSYWRMGEADPAAAAGVPAAQAADSAGENTLTNAGQCFYSGNVSPAAAAHTGSSLSVSFSGPGAYARGNLVSTAVDNFGIEAWVKTTSLSNQIIAYNGNTSLNGWGLMVAGSYWTALFGGLLIYETEPVTTNVWTHLAVVRAGGQATIYVNGVVVATTRTTPVFPTGSFALGVDPQNLTNEFLHGQLDEVRVFNFGSGQFATNDLLYFAGAPLPVTEIAFDATATGATLSGTVNPDGLATSWWFQWGTTTNYGNAIPVPVATLPPSTGPQPVGIPLPGLSPATQYHFRVAAANSAGLSYGSDNVFSTTLLFSPVVPTGARLAQTSANDTIVVPGQTVAYAVTLNAGQVLSAVLQPAGGLIPAILVTDPSGSPFALSSASSVNQNILLESVPILLSGTYQIIVSGVEGTTGSYQLSLALNAEIEQERYLDQPNNSPATAEDLMPSSIPVGSGQQMAVIGDFAGRPSQPWPDPADFYRLFLYRGQTASFMITSLQSGASQVRLEDGAGNILALGLGGFQNVSQAIINFTAAYSGYYYVVATGDSGVRYTLVASVDAAFELKPAASTSLSGLTSIYGTLVALTNTFDEATFTISANTGDNLHFATATPASGPVELVNNLYQELLLFDPNGNLVAVAAGNAGDGRNSVIDFTVPSGDTGFWSIEVTSSPNTPNPTAGDFVLTATGATGNPLTPFYCVSSIPAVGATVAPPATITVFFNQQVYGGASLTPGEMEINGVPCVAVVLSGPNSATWTTGPGTFASGNSIPDILTIGADFLGTQVSDLSGNTLTPFSETFFTSTSLIPPTAGPVTISAMEGTLTNIPASLLLSNDSSPIGGPLSLLSVASSTGATVLLTNSGTIVAYTPPLGFVGLDQFSYVLSDGRLTNNGAVTVIVTSTGAPPYNRLAITGAPADLLFEYSGLPGQQYTLQSAPTLFGPWTDFYPMPVAGISGLIQYTNRTASPPAIQFFRIRQFP